MVGVALHLCMHSVPVQDVYVARMRLCVLCRIMEHMHGCLEKGWTVPRS